MIIIVEERRREGGGGGGGWSKKENGEEEEEDDNKSILNCSPGNLEYPSSDKKDPWHSYCNTRHRPPRKGGGKEVLSGSGPTVT